MSGKTQWLLELLRYREQMFSAVFDDIYYFLPAETQYSRDHFAKKLKDEFNFIKMEYGLPKYRHVFGNPLPKLFIIDDQMKEISQSSEMENVNITF
jgi:hypothetical protein